ncbi:Homeobox protein SMOX-1 [Schistosoma japonicum]|uniref:Homeobox protein SMOX-1 n=1 Tax=Schistosoma japonicum TaxID=6182 RepID=A0A4Z2DY41_SCHJA|nr:Homeobox protein SMOX-1 [Schistosoma japonicum]
MLTMQPNYYGTRVDTRLSGPVLTSQLTNYSQNQQTAHQQQQQQSQHHYSHHPQQQTQPSQSHELRLSSIISPPTLNNNESTNCSDITINPNSPGEHRNFPLSRQLGLRRNKIGSQDWGQTSLECNMRVGYATTVQSSPTTNDETPTASTHSRLNTGASNGHSPVDSSPSPTIATSLTNNNNNTNSVGMNTGMINQQFYSDINLIRQSNDLISSTASNVYGRNAPKELDYLLAANAAAALVSQLGGGGVNSGGGGSGSSVSNLNPNLSVEQLNNSSKLIHRDINSLESFAGKNFFMSNELRYNGTTNNNTNGNISSSSNIPYDEQQRLMYSGTEQKYSNSSQLKSYPNGLLNPFNGTNFMHSAVQSNSLMARHSNNSFPSNATSDSNNSNNSNNAGNNNMNDSRSHNNLYDISSFNTQNPYSLTNTFNFNSRSMVHQSNMNDSMKLNGNLTLRDTNYQALLNSPSSFGSTVFRSLVNSENQSYLTSPNDLINQSTQQNILMNSSLDNNNNSLLNDNSNNCTGQSLRQSGNSNDSSVVVYPWMNPKGTEIKTFFTKENDICYRST